MLKNRKEATKVDAGWERAACHRGRDLRGERFAPVITDWQLPSLPASLKAPRASSPWSPAACGHSLLQPFRTHPLAQASVRAETLRKQTWVGQQGVVRSAGFKGTRGELSGKHGVGVVCFQLFIFLTGKYFGNTLSVVTVVSAPTKAAQDTDPDSAVHPYSAGFFFLNWSYSSCPKELVPRGQKIAGTGCAHIAPSHKQLQTLTVTTHFCKVLSD